MFSLVCWNILFLMLWKWHTRHPPPYIKCLPPPTTMSTTPNSNSSNLQDCAFPYFYDILILLNPLGILYKSTPYRKCYRSITNSNKSYSLGFQSTMQALPWRPVEYWFISCPMLCSIQQINHITETCQFGFLNNNLTKIAGYGFWLLMHMLLAALCCKSDEGNHHCDPHKTSNTILANHMRRQ